MRIEPGFYRCTAVGEDDELSMGDLVYAVTHEDVGKVNVLANGDNYTYDYDDFLGSFEPAPDGEAELRSSIIGIMDEVSEAEADLSVASVQMVQFQPHIARLSSGDEIAGGGALMPAKQSVPAHTKQAIATIRNTIGRGKKLLDLKQKELTELIEIRTTAMQMRVDEMNRMVAKANEVIWTINLYMGKREEIHQLAEGEPAPKSERISIRQTVLFMDEECMAMAGDDGIDVGSIDIFDEWVVKPENLNRLLPEIKGIVCLHPRSSKKEYNDPWVNVQMNSANLNYTYFLMRNGDNVYRIYADIVLGGTMFPSAGEFEELFFKSVYDHDAGKQRDEPIRPGDEDYMKAMDACEEKQRHYLRILLILQGLLDRTEIFEPLPVQKINICNRADYFEFLRFIYDQDNVLDDDELPFRSWRNNTNGGLEVGHRILGVFSSYKFKLHGGNDDQGRVHPRTAGSPRDNQLHTISKIEDGMYGGTHYCFTYDRTDEIWNRYDGYHDAQTRASCYVFIDDELILDFDAAKEKDIRYYLGSGKGRKEYTVMLPLLELALKLKQKEAKEEKPFEQLLAAQIASTHHVELSTAEAAVPEIVKWWKFKNRTHRALLSDDAKALKMIVTEYGLRIKRESERAALTERHDAVVDAVRLICYPIIVAHKSKNKYVALVPHNNDNIWVSEQTWTYNKITHAIYMSDEKKWKLVDKRYKRWEIVYKTDRWESWVINPRPSTVLSGPEIDNLIDQAVVIRRERFEEQSSDRDNFRRYRQNYFHSFRSRDRTREQRFLPLAVTVSSKFSCRSPVRWLHFWYSDEGPTLPTSRLYSRSIDGPEVYECRIDYTKKSNKISCHVRSASHTSWGPWMKADKFHGRSDQVVRTWDDNIKIIKDQKAKAKVLKDESRKIERSVEYVGRSIADYYHAQQMHVYFMEYTDDHGDLELWEDHEKELTYDTLRQEQVVRACCLCAERGIDVVGTTIGEVIEKALVFGLLSKKKFSHNWNDVDSNIPLDYKIPGPPPPDPEEYEEDDYE